MYYVRLRGKVMGPFSLEHIKALVQRGQVAAFHEISSDGMSWTAAGSVAELFPALAIPAPLLVPVESVHVEAPAPGAQRRRPRDLNCWECGVFLEQGSAYCPECGAEQRKESFDSRSRSSSRLHSHRGGTILTLGILSLVLLPILGPFAWIMGGDDLKAMDRGTMDPSGRGSTQAGYVLGIISTALMLIVLVLATCWWVFLVSALRRF